MTLGAKRSPSPLPSHLDAIKKIRITHQKKDDSQRQSVSLRDPNATPQRGQEVLCLSPLLPLASRHENINDVILQTTARLAREGKRLTRAPQLLPDGIAFDWVSDPTAQSASLRALLSVQGIRPADLDRVLLRATAGIPQASSSKPAKPRPQVAAPSSSTASAPPTSQLISGDALNPIIIDDDEEPEVAGGAPQQSQRALRSSYSQVSSAITTERLTPSTPVTAKLPLAASAIPSVAMAPKEDNGFSVVGPKAALYFTPAGDDQASVVSYASSPRSGHTQEAVRDLSCDRRVASGSRSQNPPDEGGLSHFRLSPGSVRNPTPSPSTKRQLEKRRADYGNWQSLAGESSDAEMEGMRPSSRESSPDRTFPPQVTTSFPGLGFLPQTSRTLSRGT
ncbi:hypothetical protein BD414DRAFT_25307 [Trametes punicea]|nr:hypothetical protein BD414DRAFT_25307 [Trametes punicea]